MRFVSPEAVSDLGGSTANPNVVAGWRYPPARPYTVRPPPAAPVAPSGTIINAAIVAAADDRPSDGSADDSSARYSSTPVSDGGSADDSSARYSSTGVPVNSDTADVARDTNMSATHACAAAAPCISVWKRRSETE
jgi:hypothetical protein